MNIYIYIFLKLKCKASFSPPLLKNSHFLNYYKKVISKPRQKNKNKKNGKETLFRELGYISS
jgi:hypothetical protein